MARSMHRPLLLSAAMFSLSFACVLTQPAADPGEFTGQVATSVASTLTALPPTAVPPTDTPLPTPTETPIPSPTFTPPPTVPPTVAPTPKPDYACEVIEQRPFDDSVFERNADFDIKWTIVNTGALRWPRVTFLEYQNGPRMTEVLSRELPRLQPGEEHEVVFDAAAPDELDRQVMVWSVYGVGSDEDTIYRMCYPYVRIIVER